MKRRGRALKRRYGRSATADALFHDAEAAFRAGRDALSRGDLASARLEAQRVGTIGIKASRQGLSADKFGKLLRAQALLLEKAS